MSNKLVLGVRDMIRVFYWCQYVHNYNYGENKTDGVFWPYLMTSALVGIFIHGIYMFFCLSIGMLAKQGFWIPYTSSWMLGAYITYLVCIQHKGFVQGKSYFDSVEKKEKRSTALSYSFVFTAICFSTRIGTMIITFFV